MIKVKVKVIRWTDSDRGRPAQQLPISSNVSKLTPTWPENLFWTASYPVKPGKLGRGRAEDSAPGPNNSPIRNTVVATQLATPLSRIPQLALAHSSLLHSAPSQETEGLHRELILGPLLQVDEPSANHAAHPQIIFSVFEYF